MSISKLREALRVGSHDPWADSVFWKSSPSAPPAPDYKGAAVATAAGNKDAAIAAQEGSMVNQNTPYGALKYSQTGTSANGNPTYTADIALNNTGQQLLDYSNQSALGLGALQNGATQQVANTMSHPMDLSSVDDMYNKSYANQTARLDPQWQSNEEHQKNELANQGIMQGSHAYDDSMRVFNQGKNDAYQQAGQAAISNMPQTYQLASAAYNQPLNALNALRTGSQVTNPTFGNTPQQQATAGPNYLGAAQSQGQFDQGLFNAQTGAANSANSGAMGMLGTGAMAAATFF